MLQRVYAFLQFIHAGRKQFQSFGNIVHHCHPTAGSAGCYAIHLPSPLLPCPPAGTVAEASPVPRERAAEEATTQLQQAILLVSRGPSCRSCSRGSFSKKV